MSPNTTILSYHSEVLKHISREAKTPGHERTTWYFADFVNTSVVLRNTKFSKVGFWAAGPVLAFVTT